MCMQRGERYILLPCKCVGYTTRKGALHVGDGMQVHALQVWSLSCCRTSECANLQANEQCLHGIMRGPWMVWCMMGDGGDA
jgi:hypothetical protein